MMDMDALRQFATGAVEELEKTYERELQSEPSLEMMQGGRRHGDKFSKVAAA